LAEERRRGRDFRSWGICILRQRDELLEIPTRLLAVAGCLRRTSGSVEASIAVRGLLERRFELA
jgi:hypothetical protein